ncbi:ferrichrome porin FhuA [Enterobacteriaceae bacterium YMB-R22]|uniref:ferrichrome porin FhuA n=1 Tax=Tenebrionicola larvae TaxID=2815733 RepID=UPI0020122054|nr:ferrichrome porin FhuA [Tenebrionicola larvae]MBV4412557.1 ferrichrome porin FhuA [Tenebrionicola larvae]
MALSNIGLPANASVCRLAVLIAAAVGGISVTARAADNKEDTITVTAGVAGVEQESAWGPSATIAAKRTATATKTDTPIEKTPQSVSVVTREEMQMRQPASVKEALGYTPGVNVGTRGASNSYDFVVIRGFTANGLSQNNYLDGLKLQGDFYNDAVIDPYMLERAELMRGPTSVLYGKSSPGGIINMVSKRPDADSIRELQFKMGSDNLFQTGIDFGGALDDNGEYAYRLTGVARSSNAMQTYKKEQRYAVAPSFTWSPDSDTHLTFLSYFQNEPDVGYYGWLPKEGTVETLPNGKRLGRDFNEGATNNTYTRNEKMVGYAFDHAFNDTFTFRQNLRFAENKTSQNSVYGVGVCSDAYNAGNALCSALPDAEKGRYLARKYVADNEKLQNFSVDSQLQSKFATADVKHTLLTGVDFMRMRNDIDAWFGYDGSVPLLDLNNPVTGDFDFGSKEAGVSGPYSVVNKQRQAGIYVQDQAEWNNVVFTVGGRYDWVRQEAVTRGETKSISARSDSQFTGRAGVNYLFDNGITPYLSYSESFEPNTGASASGQAFKPSKGRQYEAGVKYVPKDMPVVVTGALFELTKSDNLMADPAPNHEFFSIQGGKVRARGLELEAKAAVNANINVTASYTYTDAQYTTDTKLKGNTPEQVPEHMASLWGDYTFYDGPLSGLTLGAGARYVGSAYGSPDNAFKVGSYTVANAVVKYDLARLGMSGSSVALNVNNLFDREYVASCFQTYGCFWGAERQVVATATFRF